MEERTELRRDLHELQNLRSIASRPWVKDMLSEKIKEIEGKVTIISLVVVTRGQWSSEGVILFTLMTGSGKINCFTIHWFVSIRIWYLILAILGTQAAISLVVKQFSDEGPSINLLAGSCSWWKYCNSDHREVHLPCEATDTRRGFEISELTFGRTSVTLISQEVRGIDEVGMKICLIQALNQTTFALQIKFTHVHQMYRALFGKSDVTFRFHKRHLIAYAAYDLICALYLRFMQSFVIGNTTHLLSNLQNLPKRVGTLYYYSTRGYALLFVHICNRTSSSSKNQVLLESAQWHMSRQIHYAFQRLHLSYSCSKCFLERVHFISSPPIYAWCNSVMEHKW